MREVGVRVQTHVLDTGHDVLDLAKPIVTAWLAEQIGAARKGG